MESIKYYAESEIDARYQILLNELVKKLQNHDMRTLIFRIKSLQASEIHDISLYATDYIEELKGCSSSSFVLTKLFSFFRWYDHSIIRELVTSCGCHDGMHLLDQYISQIDLLQPISYYNTPHIFSFEKIPRAHTLMAVTYKKQFCDLSLNQIYDIKCELLKLCDLTKCAFTLMGIVDYSSDVFYGFVPNAVVPLISRKVRLQASCLHKKGILEVAAYPDFSFHTGVICEAHSRNHFAFIDSVSERISFTSHSSLENKMAKTMKQRNFYYTESKRLKEETEIMHEELIKLRLENNTDKDDQLKKKQEKLESWTKYAEELQDKLEDTESQLHKEQTKVMESEEHINGMRTTIKVLKDAVASKKLNLSQIQSELLMKQQKLTLLQESYQKLITTHMELKKQHLNKEKHTEELQQQIEMIELLLSAEQAKVKASEEDIKEFTTTIENMKVAAVIQNEGLSQTESALSIKILQLKELQASFSKLNDKYISLQVQQSDREKQTKELQEELSNKKSELAQIRKIHDHNEKLREANFQQSLTVIQVIRRCVTCLKKKFKFDDIEEKSDIEEETEEDDSLSASHEDQQSVLILQFQQLQIEISELKLLMGKAESSAEQEEVLCNLEVESLQQFELSLAQVIEYFTDEYSEAIEHLLYDSLKSQKKLFQAQALIAELKAALKEAERDDALYFDTVSQVLIDPGTSTQKELETTIKTLVDYLLETQFTYQEKINELYDKSTKNSREESKEMELDGTAGTSMEALMDQTRDTLCEFFQLTKEDAHEKCKKMEELLSYLQNHKDKTVKIIDSLTRELQHCRMNPSVVQRQTACVTVVSQLQEMQIYLEEMQCDRTCRIGISVNSLINEKRCPFSEIKLKTKTEIVEMFFKNVNCGVNALLKCPETLLWICSEIYKACKVEQEVNFRELYLTRRGGLLEEVKDCNQPTKNGNSNHSKATPGEETTSTSLTQKDMKHLVNIVLPKIAADWKLVAFNLEFETSAIRIIQQRGRDDPEDCCLEMLTDWVTKGHGVGPKTWAILLCALKNIRKLTNACNEIEEELKLIKS